MVFTLVDSIRHFLYEVLQCCVVVLQCCSVVVSVLQHCRNTGTSTYFRYILLTVSC